MNIGESFDGLSCLQIFHNNQVVTIRGDMNGSPQVAFLHQMYRLNSSKGIEQCYTLIVSEFKKKNIAGQYML